MYDTTNEQEFNDLGLPRKIKKAVPRVKVIKTVRDNAYELENGDITLNELSRVSNVHVSTLRRECMKQGLTLPKWKKPGEQPRAVDQDYLPKFHDFAYKKWTAENLQQIIRERF